MKLSAILVGLYLVLPFLGEAQGTSCAGAITISLDGVLRTYPASSATGSNLLCTNNGTTPVTWFKFTSNAQGECPLLKITASDSLAIEVAFHTSCSSMLSSSSMCFYSGYGLWAPNENFITTPNTTYYLRVKTSTSCNITIAGQHFSPPNDNCLGAVSIDATSLLPDNNSCNHASAGITASQLCGLILENTAWYQFYVATTGYSIITISNIHCDNGAANNNNGFQVGFFTGSCSALQWQNCENGSGSTVQATTTLLPAGTKVFVAIDGVSGANCSYTITGFNITGSLSGTLRKFSGWKSARSNVLQWTTLHEAGGYYIIERSLNGTDFTALGRINSIVSASGEQAYNFEDFDPPFKAFYRLRQIDPGGKANYSNIISINREQFPGLQVVVDNYAGNKLNLSISTDFAGPYNYRIINMQGQTLITAKKIFDKGINHFSQDVSKMPAGQYGFLIANDKERANKIFLKK
jgi:hypothetical protein